MSFVFMDFAWLNFTVNFYAWDVAFLDNIWNWFAKDYSHCMQMQYYANFAKINLTVNWAIEECFTGAYDLYLGTSNKNGYSCPVI
jgi:hypothetical protein